MWFPWAALCGPRFSYSSAPQLYAHDISLISPTGSNWIFYLAHSLSSSAAQNTRILHFKPYQWPIHHPGITDLCSMISSASSLYQQSFSVLRFSQGIQTFFADSTAFLSFWEHFLSTDVQNFSTPITFLLFWAYCVSISPCMKWPRCVQDEKQRPEKSQLSSWQTFTRKNFPDKARKSFPRHRCQKCVNCFRDINAKSA